MTNRRRTRKPSPAEIELWRTAMQGTTPLPGREARKDAEAEPPEPSPSPPARKHRPSAAPRTSPPEPARRPAAGSRPEPMAELAHGRGAGMDRRQADRLRRGRLPIEGRLDLHGMTQREAHDRLNAFIADAVAAGKRCVLVITGKGLARDGSGVLREAVPRWLNTPPLREHVLVFDYAQPRHGGLGALYVLLKRKR